MPLHLVSVDEHSPAQRLGWNLAVRCWPLMVTP